MCACLCSAVAAILLEYSEGCWEEALAIWSLLPALHNKNRHTSTPVIDDKETGTAGEVGGGGRGWERLRRGKETTSRASSIKILNVAPVVTENALKKHKTGLTEHSTLYP